MGSKQSTIRPRTPQSAEAMKKLIRNCRQNRRLVYRVNRDSKRISRASKYQSQEILNGRPKMKRSSSFLPDGCAHCRHSHHRKCCMSGTESLRDVLGYSEWISDFQRPRQQVKRRNITKIPEAVAGQFTPKGFPGFSDKNPVKRGRSTPKKRKVGKFIDLMVKLNVICLKGKEDTTVKQRTLTATRDFNDLESYYGFNRDFYANQIFGFGF